MMEQSRLDQDQVARRAYERYEERGREDGRDQEDWFAAEQELSGRSSESSADRPRSERMQGSAAAGSPERTVGARTMGSAVGDDAEAGARRPRGRE
jgi:hypothetical protein